MTPKRVPIEVAEDLVNLGYKDGSKTIGYMRADPAHVVVTPGRQVDVPAPFIMEAWVWLWTHTTIKLEMYYDEEKNCTFLRDNTTGQIQMATDNNPETLLGQVLEQYSKKGILKELALK